MWSQKHFWIREYKTQPFAWIGVVNPIVLIRISPEVLWLRSCDVHKSEYFCGSWYETLHEFPSFMVIRAHSHWCQSTGSFSIALLHDLILRYFVSVRNEGNFVFRCLVSKLEHLKGTSHAKVHCFHCLLRY